MSLKSRTTGSGCVFCLCVEKSVGSESALSTASRRCFGLGDHRCRLVSLVLLQIRWQNKAGLCLKFLPDLLPMCRQRVGASFMDITRLAI